MNEKSNDWKTPSVVAAIISAIVSVIGAGAAWTSATAARVSSEQAFAVGIYLDLMERFDSVAQAIPADYRIGDPPPPAMYSNAWQAISKYWYLAFEEWRITKHSGNEALAILWDERYQDLIASQLNKQAYRAVLCDLIREKFSQNPRQTEFGGMYSSLYQARSGKKLCAESGVAAGDSQRRAGSNDGGTACAGRENMIACPK